MHFYFKKFILPVTLADTVIGVRSFSRSRAVIVLALFFCLLSAGLGSVTVVDNVVDTVAVQEATAPGSDDALVVPAVAQPQPSADDYDIRLYRADLARAKRWGS